jgi:hypothetical protein
LIGWEEKEGGKEEERKEEIQPKARMVEIQGIRKFLDEEW